jgi:exodeoxyribonuclease V alpha subunit
VRIFKTYGAEAVELSRAIRSIGFLSIDTIAQKLVIARDSPLSARAGISHALAKAAAEGHCGLPHAELVPLAVKLLETAPDVIEAAITQNIEDGVLVLETIDSQPRLFLAPLHQAKRSITAQVARLMKVPRCLDWCLSWWRHGRCPRRAH